MRRTLVTLHLWLGLTIGAVWAVQGLTGALLVFHRELDRWAVPALASGPTASFSDLFRAGEAATGAPLNRLSVMDGHGDRLLAESAKRPAVVLDAATGRVLARRELEPRSPFGGSAWRWTYELHHRLLLGDRGEGLVGASGLALLSSALMGLWIGWPVRGRWAAAFAIRRWGGVRQKLYGWHRASGLLVAAALVVIPATGAVMVWQPELRGLVGGWVKLQAPPKPIAARRPPRINADRAWAAAHARFPFARFVRLMPPSPKNGAWTVRLRQPGEVRAWSGVTFVGVDAADGRIVSIYDPLRALPANQAFDAAFSVHQGEIAGLPGRALTMLAGLSLPALYITGLWSWLRRKSMRRAATAARDPTAPSARA